MVDSLLATIIVLWGRYTNRIVRDRFTLEGRTYRLAVNNGPNHLNRGLKGYNKVVCRARSFQRRDTVHVLSP
jgi:aldose 1-epimerase